MASWACRLATRVTVGARTPGAVSGAGDVASREQERQVPGVLGQDGGHLAEGAAHRAVHHRHAELPGRIDEVPPGR